MNETYVRFRGRWIVLYRAVDKEGGTVDFLLTAERDSSAALWFLRQALRNNGTPEKINIDKSGANTAAIEAYNEEAGKAIVIRQCKAQNIIVEQDHRPSKRKMNQALGFSIFTPPMRPVRTF